MMSLVPPALAALLQLPLCMLAALDCCVACRWALH